MQIAPTMRSIPLKIGPEDTSSESLNGSSLMIDDASSSPFLYLWDTDFVSSRVLLIGSVQDPSLLGFKCTTQTNTNTKTFTESIAEEKFLPSPGYYKKNNPIKYI